MDNKQVLVVDDDELTTVLMGRYLGAMGVGSITVQDGEEALRMLKERRDQVGLVLLDLAMPRLDGYQVCKQIRADPDLADLPVVVLTARVGAEARERALEAGVNEILTKPFSREDILRVLNSYLLVT